METTRDLTGSAPRSVASTTSRDSFVKHRESARTAVGSFVKRRPVSDDQIATSFPAVSVAMNFPCNCSITPRSARGPAALVAGVD